MWRVYVTRRSNSSCVLIAESDSAIRKVKQVRAVYIYKNKQETEYMIDKNRWELYFVPAKELLARKNDRTYYHRPVCLRTLSNEQLYKRERKRVYETLKFYQKSNWINPSRLYTYYYM